MADVKINAQQWNSVSKEEQQRIENALRETGALKAGDRIVGAEDVPPFTADTELAPMWNPIKDVCKVACDSAAAAAVAWCTANTAGVGLAACVAAAEAARQVCRDRC